MDNNEIIWINVLDLSHGCNESSPTCLNNLLELLPVHASLLGASGTGSRKDVFSMVEATGCMCMLSILHRFLVDDNILITRKDLVGLATCIKVLWCEDLMHKTGSNQPLYASGGALALDEDKRFILAQGDIL